MLFFAELLNRIGSRRSPKSGDLAVDIVDEVDGVLVVVLGGG